MISNNNNSKEAYNKEDDLAASSNSIAFNHGNIMSRADMSDISTLTANNGP
jgi:hypothetical protein